MRLYIPRWTAVLMVLGIFSLGISVHRVAVGREPAWGPVVTVIALAFLWRHVRVLPHGQPDDAPSPSPD